MTESAWTFEKPSVLSGFLAGLGLHVFQIVLLPIFQGSTLALVGATQLVYVIPALIFAAKRKRKDWIIGLLIAAGVTLLVNAVCWGIIVASLGH